MVAAVMTEVGRDGAGTKVNVFADNGITAVAEMANGASRQDDAVLDLDGLTDSATGSDRGSPPDVTIGSDCAVLSHNDVTFNIDSG